MDENKLIEDIGKYLNEKGYSPVIIEIKGVSQRGLKNNFSLIINFTGTKK